MASYREPPPSHLEENSKQAHIVSKDETKHKIIRKPLAPSQPSWTGPKREPRMTVKSPQEMVDVKVERLRDLNLEEERPELPPRPEISLKTNLLADFEDSQLFSIPARTNTGTTTTSTSSIPSSSISSSLSSPSLSRQSISPTSTKSSASASLQKAYREARHIAGGLIHHPFESTKHFTILRHSHGLVFYQGPSTCLAISIFSSSLLPEDRTLWLQSKGWTGKTGMRARALMGRNNNWLNVTPTTELSADQLKVEDERAWQRDFAKFRKKADRKARENHVLRETCVVRIPAEAGDGYFQLLLCIGEKKKVLCPSPVFRLLSTSASPSSVRGASLSTLPLEFGAMVLSMKAKATVGTAASVVTAPFSSQVAQYMPSWWERKAASAAYGMTVEKRVDSTIGDANTRYELQLDGSSSTAGDVELALEQGPKAPFPICFVSRSEVGTANEEEQSGTPTINLASVPDNISPQLHGYYFGWVRFMQKLEKKVPIDSDNSWCQAIIKALPADLSRFTRIDVSQTGKKSFSFQLLNDLDEPPIDPTKVEAQVIGFIRPDEPTQRSRLHNGLESGDEAAAEAAMLAEMNDVSMAQEFLDHPAWGPDVLLSKADEGGKRRMENAKMGYANTRMATQKQIDRVPLNKFGFRAPGDKMKDKAAVGSGFYVER